MSTLIADHVKIIKEYGFVPILRELTPNVHQDTAATKPQLIILRRVILFEPPLKDRFFQALEVPQLLRLITDCKSRGIEIRHIH